MLSGGSLKLVNFRDQGHKRIRTEEPHDRDSNIKQPKS